MAASRTLEVILVGATDLKDTEFFGKADPYAIVTCGSQQARTSTAEDQGSNPVWNHRLGFTVGDPVPTSLSIKIMNENVFKDDEIGTCHIPLGRVFSEGRVPEMKYPVFRPSGKQQGEIEVILVYQNGKKTTKAPADPPVKPAIQQSEAHSSHNYEAPVAYPPAYHQASAVYPPQPMYHQPTAAYPSDVYYQPPVTYPPPQHHGHETSQVYPPQYPPVGAGEYFAAAPGEVKHDKHKLKKKHKHKHQKFKHSKLGQRKWD